VFTPVLISVDSFRKILTKAYNNSYYQNIQELPIEVPKRAAYIKLASQITKQERNDIVNALNNFIRTEEIFITDTAGVATSADDALSILNLFFNLVALTIIILCFFVLIISFTANVRENAWEFGVLRAIGLTAAQAIRVYIYEALCVIISSVFLGYCIGEIVAITLTLQTDLFSEMPFKMEFPFLLFFGIVGMSMIVAVVGSLIPAYALKNKKIAQALKNI